MLTSGFSSYTTVPLPIPQHYIEISTFRVSTPYISRRDRRPGEE